MKKYTFIAFLALAGFFTSCDKDVKGPLYNEDDITGNTGNVIPQGVTFQAASFNHEMAAEDNGKIYVPIIRNNEKVNSVKVAFYNTYVIDKDNKGEDVTEQRMDSVFIAEDGNIFKLESPTVTFKPGELTAYAVITYNSVEDMDPTKGYATSLVVTEGNIGLDGFKEVSMVVSRKLTFHEIGKGYFAGPFGNFYNKDTLAKYPSGYIPAIIEKAEEGNIFRVKNPFGLLNPDNAGSDLVFVIQKEVNGDGFHKVTYTSFSTGYDPDGSGDFIWAHFIESKHIDYCYLVPAGVMDNLHKSDGIKKENVIGLYGRFMDEGQGSGYKPNDQTIPDDWAWEYSVILPSDYVYSE